MRLSPRFTALFITSALAATTSVAHANTIGAAQETTRKPTQDTARARDTTAKAQDAEGSAPKKRPVRTVALAPVPVWPVEGPPPLPGSILPERRIIAFYGNPLSKRMGILGELPPEPATPPWETP